MAWVTPKTNWYGSRDSSGTYTGDRFNVSDYNRIVGNLTEIYNRAVDLYGSFEITAMRTINVDGYFFASDFNAIEANLAVINGNSIDKESYRNRRYFYTNGPFIDYAELNRIESAILDIYNNLVNAADAIRTFTWNFGLPGGY